MTRIEEFKEKLIDSLEEKGGVYAPKLMQNIDKNGCRYKKFFAFKRDKEDIMEHLDFVARAIMQEIDCNYFIFNPAIIESFKDTTELCELIRGMVYYERIKRTDG